MNCAIQRVTVQDWTDADFPIPTTFQKEDPERIVVEGLTEESVMDFEKRAHALKVVTIIKQTPNESIR